MVQSPGLGSGGRGFKSRRPDTATGPVNTGLQCSRKIRTAAEPHRLLGGRPPQGELPAGGEELGARYCGAGYAIGWLTLSETAGQSPPGATLGDLFKVMPRDRLERIAAELRVGGLEILEVEPDG